MDKKILLQALLDIKKFGVHHDLHPTMSHKWSVEDWCSYLHSANARVKEIASKALEDVGYQVPVCSCGKTPHFTHHQTFSCFCGNEYDVEGNMIESAELKELARKLNEEYNTAEKGNITFKANGNVVVAIFKEDFIKAMMGK